MGEAEAARVARIRQSQMDAPDPSMAIGDAVRLMLASPAHRGLSLTAFQERVAPAVELDQFRILRKQGRPLAYLSWAKLDAAAERRIAGSGTVAVLSPEDWNSGERPWIVDHIASTPAAEAALARVEHSLFGPTLPKTLADLAPSARIDARAVGEKAGGKGAPGSVSVRLAREEADLETIADMLAVHHGELGFADTIPDRERQLAHWRAQWAESPSKYAILIAELGSAPVGLLIAQVGGHVFTSARAAQCLWFYVDPAHRGGFAAVKLLRAFRAWAEAAKIDVMTMHVTSGLAPARTDKLLRRLGFRQMGGNYECVLGRGGDHAG